MTNKMMPGWVVGRIIKDFPYPERFCPYCERPLVLQKAAHIDLHEEFFKAVYYCLNESCEAYDEPARKCYALVYYSDKIAQRALETIPIIMPERKRK